MLHATQMFHCISNMQLVVNISLCQKKYKGIIHIKYTSNTHQSKERYSLHEESFCILFDIMGLFVVKGR